MAFITVVLEHFVNDITSTFSLVPNFFFLLFFFHISWRDFQWLHHEKTDPTLCPGSLENHGAVLGEIRGSPAPTAAKRRCMGKCMGSEQAQFLKHAHAPSFQHFLNQRLHKRLLCAELMELIDFFTINLSNILLNPYKQHLVARRSAALANRVKQFSVVV